MTTHRRGVKSTLHTNECVRHVTKRLMATKNNSEKAISQLQLSHTAAFPVFLSRPIAADAHTPTRQTSEKFDAAVTTRRHDGFSSCAARWRSITASSHSPTDVADISRRHRNPSATPSATSGRIVRATVDQGLSCDLHVSAMLKQCSQRIYLLRMLRSQGLSADHLSTILLV